MLLSYQHTTTILCYLFSDGWAKDDLIYQWKQKDPVQVVPNLHLPRFTLEQYKSAYCDVITNTGINTNLYYCIATYYNMGLHLQENIRA